MYAPRVYQMNTEYTEFIDNLIARFTKNAFRPPL